MLEILLGKLSISDCKLNLVSLEYHGAEYYEEADGITQVKCVEPEHRHSIHQKIDLHLSL